MSGLLDRRLFGRLDDRLASLAGWLAPLTHSFIYSYMYFPYFHVMTDRRRTGKRSIRQAGRKAGRHCILL